MDVLLPILPVPVNPSAPEFLFGNLSSPEVEVDPKGNPYLDDGQPGIGRIQSQSTDEDFVVYEDPELTVRSPKGGNATLYQELQVTAHLTDINIVGKILLESLENTSNEIPNKILEGEGKGSTSNV